MIAEPIHDVVLRRLEQERLTVDPIMKDTKDEDDDDDDDDDNDNGNGQHKGTPAIMEKIHDEETTVKETKEDSAHQNEVTPAVKKMKIN